MTLTAQQEQQSEAIFKIWDGMLDDWHQGRATSPSNMDYVLSGVEYLGADWDDNIKDNVSNILDDIFMAGATLETGAFFFVQFADLISKTA